MITYAVVALDMQGGNRFSWIEVTKNQVENTKIPV